MRIGELAARSGVSVHALRYYEAQGLLIPERNSSGAASLPGGRRRECGKCLVAGQVFA
jgi:DNA-binding transcriptional MerR regulator